MKRTFHKTSLKKIFFSLVLQKKPSAIEVKMTEYSAMRGLLDPIGNSTILKSVLRKAVLCEA